jgi:hypothetical protein
MARRNSQRFQHETKDENENRTHFANFLHSVVVGRSLRRPRSGPVVATVALRAWSLASPLQKSPRPNSQPPHLQQEAKSENENRTHFCQLFANCAPHIPFPVGNLKLETTPPGVRRGI